MPSTFSAYPEITAGFFMAVDGTMAINGGFENRLKYLQTHDLNLEQTVHAGLCHGTKIALVAAVDGGKIVDNTDGLITGEPNLALAMTAADCLLLSAYDPVQKVIGQLHAGRRGLAENVITQFFSFWITTFPSKAEDIIVDCSPSICAQHYTVSEEDAEKFAIWPDACQKRGDAIHLDMRKVSRHQLLKSGVLPENIITSQRCTFEDTQLFSYRRDHPNTPQLQVGYISRSV